MPSLQHPSFGDQELRERKTDLNDATDDSTCRHGIGCDLDDIERKMSLDSSSAMKDLKDLAGQYAFESTWVFAMLFCTCGLPGSERVLVRSLVLILILWHATYPPLYAFLIGWPVFLCCFFGGFYCVFLLPAPFVRQSFLRSGLIQSLVHVTKHRDILDRFDKSCRTLLLGTAAEGLALNITATTVVLRAFADTQRFDKAFGSTQWLFGVYGITNSFLHFVSVLLAKQLPMFLGLICDVLVADLQQFHHTVDILFRNREQKSGASLLEELHKHECSLRIRLAATNKSILPMVLVVLLSNLVEVLGCLLLFVCCILYNTHIAITAIMIFLTLQYSIWLLSALRNIARVGDEWHHIIEELNTPSLCSATASVLGGISLDDRLGRLRYMGITILETTITSWTVAYVAFTIAFGLFLTALGIVFQIQFEK